MFVDSLSAILLVLRLELYDQANQPAGGKIEYANDYQHDNNERKDNQRIVDHVLLRGPGNLLHLMLHVHEEATDALEQTGEPIANALEEARLDIRVYFSLRHNHTSFSSVERSA